MCKYVNRYQRSNIDDESRTLLHFTSPRPNNTPVTAKPFQGPSFISVRMCEKDMLCTGWPDLVSHIIILLSCPADAIYRDVTSKLTHLATNVSNSKPPSLPRPFVLPGVVTHKVYTFVNIDIPHT